MTIRKLMCVFVLAFVSVGSAHAYDFKGFQFYPKSSTDYCGGAMRESIGHLASIGANVIPLLVETYQDSFESYDFYSDGGTPTDTCLHEVSRYITNDLGMEIAYFFRPETRAGWRRYIDPQSDFARDQWFENYKKYLVRYSREFAQKYSARFIVIGTELHNMVSIDHDRRNEGKWPQMISAVRKVYSGLVTYSAQHPDSLRDEHSIVFDNNDLIKSLDFLGFSGYWPLSGASDVASALGKLEEFDRAVIQKAYDRYDRMPFVLLESGYRPQQITFAEPYNSWSTEPYNGQAQADAWEAFITFCDRKQWCHGIIGWAWETDPTLGGDGDITYTPWGKSAADVIRVMWGGDGDLTVTEPTAPEPVVESEPDPATPTPTPDPSPNPVVSDPTPVVDDPIPQQPMGPVSYGTPGLDQKCEHGEVVLYADNYFFSILWSAGANACWAYGEKPPKESYVGFVQDDGTILSTDTSPEDLPLCPWAVTDHDHDGYGWTDQTKECIVDDLILESGLVVEHGGALYHEHTGGNSVQTGSGSVSVLLLFLLGIGGLVRRTM